MHSEHRYRIVVLIMACVMLVTSIWDGSTPQQFAQASPRPRTLTMAETDAAAHAVGSEWHNPNNLPSVVDFSANPDQTSVGGIDQWVQQQGQAPTIAKPSAGVDGKNKALIIRVHYSDATQRLNNTQLTTNWLTPLNNHFTTISNGKNQGWDFTFYGPVNVGNRSDFVLGNDQLADDTVTPAIDKSKSLIDAVIAASDASSLEPLVTNADTVIFLMDNSSQSRMRGVNYSSHLYDFCPPLSVCIVPQPDTRYRNTIFIDEGGTNTNATALDQDMWGVLAHELGHALQVYAGLGDHWNYGHPSNYLSQFELMDANYPGHVSAHLKTFTFASWLPPSYIIDVNNAGSTMKPSSMGYCIRAIEYNPASYPVPQIIRVKITESVYYLISARKRINGDQLMPIPGEGVLIERVVSSGNLQWEDVDSDGIIDVDLPETPDINESENIDQKVVVRGRVTTANGIADRNALWQVGDVYSATYDGAVGINMADGVSFEIKSSQTSGETWCIQVRYGALAMQPDVGIYPWRQPPGETYETTDIWVDSPLNGYGNYRYGMWNDLKGLSVPRGNGDDPAIGAINRVYTRVRNFGTATATNVQVQIKVSNPLGVGIQNDAWAPIGNLITSARFPGLASIPPGGYVDVYTEWVPNPPLTEEQKNAGVFSFHTCLRVEILPVGASGAIPAELILGNQDGIDEQENIQNFEATPKRSPVFEHEFRVVNKKTANQLVSIFQQNNLPSGWELNINDGDPIIALASQQSATVPISITASGASVIGSSFTVQVSAAEHKTLTNLAAKNTKHLTFNEIGGYNFTVNVLADTRIACKAYRSGAFVEVVGSLDGFEGIHQAGTPLRAYAQVYGVTAGLDTAIPLDDRASGNVGVDGDFRMRFSVRSSQAHGGFVEPQKVQCIFPGTHLLASSSTSRQAVLNAVPPTTTIVPWAASQFHSSLALNNHLAPLTAYSDMVSGATLGNTFNCALIYCPILVDGVHGRAVHFESGKYAFLQSANPVNLGPSFSVGMWVKRTRINTQEILLSHGATLFTGQLFNMGFRPDNTFFCSTYSDDIASTTLFTDKDWHHVTCVVNGYTRSLYVDGILENTATVGIPPYAQNAKMTLAWRSDGMPSFNGQIDEVRIFNIALSAGTVSSLATLPYVDPLTPNPMSSLTFNDIYVPEMNGVFAYCGGGNCPDVYYPEDVLPRPLERIAAIKMQARRSIGYYATTVSAPGTDSTLLFWARLDGSSAINRALAAMSPGINRPSVFWRGSTRTLTFGSLSHVWSDFNTGWHHFAFVKDATTLQIYIDGNKVAEGPAPAGMQPMRVANGIALMVGGADSGEMSAVELANFAYGGNRIVGHYVGGFPLTAVVPTKTLTASQTPSQTPIPVMTIPAVDLVKTSAALIATSKAKQTIAAAPGATQTKAAQLQQTAMALYLTQWADLSRTDVALNTRTLVPTRPAAFTLIPALPTFVIFRTSTPNLAITVTRSRTSTATLTASITATPTATASHTHTVTTTGSPTQSRTRIFTATFQPSVTRPTQTSSRTMTRTSTQSATPLGRPTFTPSRTVITKTFTMTSTASRTQTASATSTPGNFGTGTIPVKNLPVEMQYRVLQHIADERANVDPDWNTVTLGENAVPFYRPDIDSGNSPAYYEISVFADSARTIPRGFVMLTIPDVTGNGHDYPIPHWKSSGLAVSRVLLNQSPSSTSLKLFKLDSLGYVGVVGERIVARRGNFPQLINGLNTSFDEIARDPARNVTDVYWNNSQDSTSDNAQVPMPDVRLTGVTDREAAQLWSWDDTDYSNAFDAYSRGYSTSFAPLISQLRAQSAPHWAIEQRIIQRSSGAGGAVPFVLSVPVPENSKASVVIPVPGATSSDIVTEGANAGFSWSLDATSIDVADKQFLKYPIMNISTGALPRDGMGNIVSFPRMRMRVYQRGTLTTNPQIVFDLVIVMTEQVRHQDQTLNSRGWSSWSSYYHVDGDRKTSDARQRWYDQFEVPGSCLSGCGPTAWMMLFGWVDFKSSLTYPASSYWLRPNAFRNMGGYVGNQANGGGTSIVAPSTLSIGIKNSTLQIRNSIWTTCTWVNSDSNAATAPFMMEDVIYYLNSVNSGLSIDTHYCVVGCHEDRLTRYTLSHLKHSTQWLRRPVIIGTGFLAHYPLAYGVKYRTRPEDWDEGYFDGDDVVWDTVWLVNQGWGDKEGEWVSGGTWFAGRVFDPTHP